MKSKTKIMTIAAASLACIAVAGVGFASWVITATNEQNITGNLQVEEVSNESVTLTAAGFDADDNINLIYSRTGGEQNNDWIVWEDNDADDQNNLTYNTQAAGTLAVNGDSFTTLKIIFYVVDGGSSTTSDLIAVGKTATEPNTFAGAVANGLVDFPTIKLGNATFAKAADATTYVDDKGTAETNDDATYTAYEYTLPVASVENKAGTAMNLTVDFAWGTTFGNKNPADYYNAIDSASQIGNASAITHAETYLTYLYKCFNGSKYNLVISVVK